MRIKYTHVLFVLPLFYVILFCHRIEAENWLKWRGPSGNGISVESNWNPYALKNGAKIRWKIKLGEGYSSVTVRDHSLYTMGNSNHTDIIYCLDVRTGMEKWRFTYACQNRSYTGSFSTPVIDGDRVYALSRNGDVHCLDAKTGKRKWYFNVSNEPSHPGPKYGYAGSPLIFQDQLILNAGKHGVSLNKYTGKKIWDSRPGKAGYASPVVYRYAGQDNVVIFSHRQLNGVDLNTGKRLWSFPWVFDDGADSADPVVVGNRIFISTAYRNGATMIDFSQNRPKQKWFKKEIQDEFGSSIYVNGYLYVPDGDTRHRTAYLKCIKFITGEQMWSWDTGHCSLIYVDKKFIVLNQWGVLTIMKADEKGYKDLSFAKVIETSSRVRCWTAPVLANGVIYVRTSAGDLISVDVTY